MIVVKVELWSAITGVKTELARMHICNRADETCTNTQGNYDVTTFRGRSAKQLDKLSPMHEGQVFKHQRLSLHVWNLVRKALVAAGYNK